MAEPIEVKRRLAAIFAADVEGYSRLMGSDEVATLTALTVAPAAPPAAAGTHTEFVVPGEQGARP